MGRGEPRFRVSWSEKVLTWGSCRWFVSVLVSPIIGSPFPLGAAWHGSSATDCRFWQLTIRSLVQSANAWACYFRLLDLLLLDEAYWRQTEFGWWMQFGDFFPTQHNPLQCLWYSSAPSVVSVLRFVQVHNWARYPFFELQFYMWELLPASVIAPFRVSHIPFWVFLNLTDYPPELL